MSVAMLHDGPVRRALVRRGLMLNFATIAYNCIEAAVALVSGTLAGSVALVGFGFDSVIEVTASGAGQWRLRADVDPLRRARVERISHRIIGWSFVALAVYVLIDSAETLWRREHPRPTLTGLALLCLSVVVMPLLARLKRRVAIALGSRAMVSEAAQTSLCAYLSVIALAGVGLNAWLGWWWADPVAALAMVPIIAREGIEGIRGEPSCEDCC
jgi:divalent metal cation (Fe/Co/Zn/Cd) transporter